MRGFFSNTPLGSSWIYIELFEGKLICGKLVAKFIYDLDLQGCFEKDLLKFGCLLQEILVQRLIIRTLSLPTFNLAVLFLKRHIRTNLT